MVENNIAYQHIALTGRVLGALFYCEPDSPACSDIVAQLSGGSWVAQWPYGSEEQLASIAALLAQPDVQETREEAWQRLFIGPYALPAPPWGSVYLDKENVLFGDSTLKLRNWMAEQQVEVTLDMEEPEDQFGLLLMMAAWLAENQPEKLADLLAEHLLPWAYRYLDLLQSDAGHPFYQGLAQLATLTLIQWQHELQVTPAVIKLYR
ncbi:Cytoplasmic chaperone TorD family protein [Yersinia frederiksenii]|uniref:Tat proofreading chaperone DmsD n=2 Tax=Yersinia frederiksenii TaxID=29484 RepID=A0A380Q012_YERFR|nr:Tat proofreading chaperone DmsD [Yersinia frederiksenii]ATM97024.1 Tat proofreading chaperone DmsD [Yersinia frederiksenii]EEQ16907.1 Cytoplasmic chaperone TorD family protein [Yersinia frederiksenii ATCC 33641]KGA45427.1 twin-arginine leader-binding protein dmsD [Yersinia frederiksenii ATCC 33641]MDN0119590.1 Tat proofreading chaperone DmsD [Yersinia frederiksenii]CNB94400.1 Cytoplasmic chaperone TorD family protein [Yersinia frederiksenii]